MRMSGGTAKDTVPPWPGVRWTGCMTSGVETPCTCGYRRNRDRTTWGRGGAWYGKVRGLSSPRCRTWGTGDCDDVCLMCPACVFSVWGAKYLQNSSRIQKISIIFAPVMWNEYFYVTYWLSTIKILKRSHSHNFFKVFYTGSRSIMTLWSSRAFLCLCRFWNGLTTSNRKPFPKQGNGKIHKKPVMIWRYGIKKVYFASIKELFEAMR